MKRLVKRRPAMNDAQARRRKWNRASLAYQAIRRRFGCDAIKTGKEIEDERLAD